MMISLPVMFENLFLLSLYEIHVTDFMDVLDGFSKIPAKSGRTCVGSGIMMG